MGRTVGVSMEEVPKMNEAKTTWLLTRHRNVYIYIPNLIGYFRITSSLIAFGSAMEHPGTCVLFYLIGFICDELDGRFARMLNQSSRFGAVLDMVTDRLSTAGLLVILCMLYQEYYVYILGLLMLDIFSHWSQMYYTLTCGNATHKDIKSKSWLVRTYYSQRWFMGFCCVSCEVLYLALYLLFWDAYLKQYLGLLAIVVAVSLPGFVSKQLINVLQLRNALSGIVQEDLKSIEKQ